MSNKICGNCKHVTNGVCWLNGGEVSTNYSCEDFEPIELDISDTLMKISEWHQDRKITVNGNSATQTIKLGEEFGELCSGVNRRNKELIKDSIGDMVVVLVAIAELEGFTFDECVRAAYEEIKDRKGMLLPNGNFLKQEDMTCKDCKYLKGPIDGAPGYCSKLKTKVYSLDYNECSFWEFKDGE